MYELAQDETDKKANKIICRFLKEYKALCDKYQCMVAADGEEVEVAYAPGEITLGPASPVLDYWGVENTTARRRGWKKMKPKKGKEKRKRCEG